MEWREAVDENRGGQCGEVGGIVGEKAAYGREVGYRRSVAEREERGWTEEECEVGRDRVRLVSSEELVGDLEARTVDIQAQGGSVGQEKARTMAEIRMRQTELWGTSRMRVRSRR